MSERPDGKKDGIGDEQQAMWEQLRAELDPLIKAGALAQAKERLSALLDTMGDDQESALLRARLLSRRAELALDLDDDEGALKDAEAALRLGLRDARTYAVCGWAYHHLDKPEQARVCFDQALKTAPDELSYLAARAMVLMELDELELAKTDLNQALEIAEDDPGVLELRGEVHTLMGNLDGAIEDLERALELWPHNIEISIALARLLTVRGDLADALAIVSLAVEEGQDDEDYLTLEALLLRSHLRLLSGQGAGARADAMWASNVFSDEAFAFVQLAHVELAEGNMRLAKKAAERAVLLDPSLSDAYLVRGAAYQMQGKSAAAKEDFQRAQQAPVELPLFLLGAAHELASGAGMGFDSSILDLLTGENSPFDPAAFEKAFSHDAGAAPGADPFAAMRGMGGLGGADPTAMLDQIFDEKGNIRGPLKPLLEMAFKNAPKLMKNLPPSMLGGLSREELERLDLSDLSGEELEERMREFYQLMKSGKNPFEPDS